ncbi:MAG: phosphotransferase family protein [Tepidiformaceae bacterium]
MPWRENLTAYFTSRLPSATAVRIAALTNMTAGASNDTVGLDLSIRCDDHEFALPLVLRPQRTEGILAPYDVERQFRVMRRLALTTVPVPAVLWYEGDRAVLGAPFFLMERIAGETLPLFWYGPSPRLMAAASMLAAIHAVDWRAAGLAFLLPPTPAAEEALPRPVECELAAWRLRADGFRIGRAPLLVALADFLVHNEPSDAQHQFLHGDPNPGNYLFQGDHVAAVVDWELAAIGDPRSDLGFYAALLRVFGGMPGQGGTTLLSEAYAAVTGAPIACLEYYEALGLYRMMIILTGWGGRIGGFSHYGMDTIARRLTVLLGPNWAHGDDQLGPP